MKEVSGYNISEKEFEQISKWAEDIYYFFHLSYDD